MRKLRTHSRIYLVLKLLAVILVGKILLMGFSSLHNNAETPFSSLDNPAIVDKRRDLLNVDVSNILRHRSWSSLPFNEHTIKQSYQEEPLVGFISNLNVDKVLEKKGKETAEEKNSEGQADYQNSIACNDRAYRSKIQYSSEIKPLEDDLVKIRRDLLNGDSFLSLVVTHDEEKEMTEREIIQKRWFQFGGSTIWLEKEQCYVMYSRIMYSTAELKNTPRVSFVRAQAFDRNWIEIKGKRIPYSDIARPDDIDAALRESDKEFGFSDCSLLSSEPLAHDACIVENAKKKLTGQKRRENILSKYFLTYPTILQIPFNTDGDFRGPEDPRVVLRKTKDTEEPVVLFNMYDTDQDRRVIMAHLPHRKVDPTVKFSIVGREQKELEKNWTPFFHKSLDESSVSRGYIHFIYTFNPLEILKCSLNDGYCEMVFDANTLKLTDANRFGGIRGGTQFISLPDIIPDVRGEQIWVGFPKLHIENCGCGSHFYRPMFSVLIERDGIYSQELVIPAMGFDIDVLSWDLKGSICRDNNVLSPNSIGYWEVVNQDPQTKKFEDYLTLTISEADTGTKVITLKGILDFILGIYREKDVLDSFDINEKTDSIMSHTLHCIVESAFESCKEYGLSHPDLRDE